MTINRDGQAPDSYQGVNPVNRPKNILAQRAPATTDRRYPISTLWVDKLNNAAYQLTSVVAGSANWEVLGSATGAVSTITGDSGGALSPAAGNVTVSGGTYLPFTGSGSTLTGTLDEGVPRSASVSLTSAQVKALATTQIELVAAPGAGKMIHFLGASLKLVYGGSNVFAESADNLGIKYTDDSGVQVSATVETTGFIDQSASTYTSALAANDAIVAATAAENQALVLDNLNANITGNAANDNTLEVSVVYRVVEI